MCNYREGRIPCINALSIGALFIRRVPKDNVDESIVQAFRLPDVTMTTLTVYFDIESPWCRASCQVRRFPPSGGYVPPAFLAQL
jgi:hypothetical protein